MADESEAPPMEWSLGAIGDLMWKCFPDLRGRMKDLIVEQIESAIDEDRELRPIEGHTFLMRILGPYVTSKLSGSTPEDRVVQFCSFLWQALKYDGEERPFVQYDIAVYVLEGTDVPEVVRRILSTDPDLVKFVRSQYPPLWSAA